MYTNNKTRAVRINVLGRVEAIHLPNKPLSFSGPRSQELLASLALDAGKPVHRGVLIERLWQDKSEHSGRKALNTELWRLKKSIKAAQCNPDEWIHSADDALTLRTDTGIAIDLQQFEQYQMGQQEPANLLAAVNLYVGDFARGLNAPWIDFQRNIIRTRYVAVLQTLVKELRESNKLAEALNFAKRLCIEEPFDELSNRLLIQTLIERGERSNAIRHFKKFSQLLHDELGVTPSVETVQLYQNCIQHASQEGFISTGSKRLTKGAQPDFCARFTYARQKNSASVNAAYQPTNHRCCFFEHGLEQERFSKMPLSDQIQNLRELAEELTKKIMNLENTYHQISEEKKEPCR
jgi:DNA-binding SARP family transcriptional activator